jgi:dimethylamine monooxygenase subunit A
VSELKYFPFDGKEVRPRVGLLPLAMADWIEIDEHYEPTIDKKKKLLAEQRDAVLQVRPGADASCLELRQILAAFLAERFPDLFVMDREEIRTRGRAFARPESGSEALEQIALWTQEDWTLLSPRAPVTLEAASICFPSRWALAEKMGRDSDGIHARVPGFAAIAKATANTLERLIVGKPLWRLNWSIHDSDELFAPTPQTHSPVLDVSNVLQKTWLRVERQTLVRLPATQAVVFSIRTYLHSLDEVVANDERRSFLAETLRQLLDDSARYKGMMPFLEVLKEVLFRIS